MRKFLVDWYMDQYPIEEEDQQKYGDCDWVYLIWQTGTDIYKIGMTKNPDRRIKEISTGVPGQLEIIQAIQLEPDLDESAKYLESKLHQYFSSSRIRGEWFRLTKRDLAQLRALLHAVEGWGFYFEGDSSYDLRGACLN